MEGLQQKDAACAAIEQAQQLEPGDRHVSTQQLAERLQTMHVTSNATPTHVNMQIRQAAQRLHQAAGQSSNLTVQNLSGALTTEAPEEVHIRKRPKLQPGWLYHESQDGVDENLLILLHGYGDTPGECASQHCRKEFRG